MVNEVVQAHSDQEIIFSSANVNSKHLNWKFLDKIALLDDKLRKEDTENYFISDIDDDDDDALSTDEEQLNLLRNSFNEHLPNFDINIYHCPSVIIMNTSSIHQAKEQFNNNNNSSNTFTRSNLRNDETVVRREMDSDTNRNFNQSQQTSANNEHNLFQQENRGFHLGLQGWRKKCLYILILVLMIFIVVNLVLTLWILKVMEFSSDGMGQLKIVAGGVQLSGQALILDILRASSIRSRHGQPITIESSRNFTINTRDKNGFVNNHLFLGHDKLEILTNELRINDTNGENLFSVNRNEVAIGAHSLKIDGEGGTIFRESVQTPHIRAEAGKDLRLESPTRQLEMHAAQGINLQSVAGNAEIDALNDLRFSSVAGSIRLEAPNIFIPNLKTVQLSNTGLNQNYDRTHRVYQLCACSNGKLFLALPHAICAADESTFCR